VKFFDNVVNEKTLISKDANIANGFDRALPHTCACICRAIKLCRKCMLNHCLEWYK